MHDWKHNKIRECVSDGKEETMVGQVLNQGFLWDVGQRLRKVASASKLMVGFPKLDLRRRTSQVLVPRFVSKGSDVAWMQEPRHKPPGGCTWSRSAGSVHRYPSVTPLDAFGLASTHPSRPFRAHTCAYLMCLFRNVLLNLRSQTCAHRPLAPDISSARIHTTAQRTFVRKRRLSAWALLQSIWFSSKSRMMSERKTERTT